MKVRVRRTSWHSVQEQHRALATMGRLAAEHARPDHPPEAPSSKSAVRVVRDSYAALAPSAPPQLRSRPRRGKGPAGEPPDTGTHSATVSGTTDPDAGDPAPARQTSDPRPPTHQVLPGPSVKLVRERLSGDGSETAPAPSHPATRPVLPTIPAKRSAASSTGMLYFDAIDALAAIDADPSVNDRSGSEIAGDDKAGDPSPSGLFSPLLSRARSAFDQLWRRRSHLAPAGAAAVGQVRRRPRLATGAAAAVLLVSALAGLLASAGGGNGNAHNRASSNVPAGRGGPAPPPSASGSAGQQQVGQTPVTPATPATPSTPAALLEMTSSTSAVYQVSGPIQVVLNASGYCWIQARRAGPNGDLLFQGTLVPGQSWTVAGPTWLRLGNPTAVGLTVNGETVSPPVARGIPFDLQIG